MEISTSHVSVFYTGLNESIVGMNLFFFYAAVKEYKNMVEYADNNFNSYKHVPADMNDIILRFQHLMVGEPRK